MKNTRDKLGRILGLMVKAFILASVVAVILPVTQYAHSLSDEEYIVWLVRLVWVLMLTVGVLVVQLLVGFLIKKRHD
jgi:nitrogen fixation/metabolism regulation signal transduction histidine kinase